MHEGDVSDGLNHISNMGGQDISEKLAIREIQSHEKRIAYLNRILRDDERRRHSERFLEWIIVSLFINI